MTDLQIRELIADYEAAFNMLDAVSVAGFYDEPSTIVDESGTIVFAEKAAILENMEQLTQYYRSIGFTSAESTRIAIEHVSADIAEVDVGWTIQLGATRAEFATRYWFVDRAVGPRIAAVLAYSEKQAITGTGRGR